MDTRLRQEVDIRERCEGFQDEQPNREEAPKSRKPKSLDADWPPVEGSHKPLDSLCAQIQKAESRKSLHIGHEKQIVLATMFASPNLSSCSVVAHGPLCSRNLERPWRAIKP